MQKDKFYELLNNPDLLSGESVSELKDLVTKFSFFHAAWILYLKNLFVNGDKDFDNVLKKMAIAIPDRKRLYNFLHSRAENIAAESYFEQRGISSQRLQRNSDKTNPDNQLIDRFLSQQHESIRIEKEIRENSTNENGIAEKSIAETDELITETLALIYFEQKKYDKALDAFKKLSLKYPEKSVYFANRIEEIEKLRGI
jgi:tetratricopeptide (TPR) repeat protein